MRSLLLFSLCLVFAGHVFADVKRETKTSGTIARMGVYETSGSDFFTADKHANESTSKWTRGMMKTFSGGKALDGANIVRLDKDSVYTFDKRKETYTVMSLAELREQLKKGMMDMEGTKPEEEDEVDSTSTEDLYEWTTEDVSEADPKDINGFSCRNAHIRSTGVNKQDPNDKVIINFDMWNCENVPGTDEIMAFNEKYLKALGLDEMALKEGMLASAWMYQGKLAELIEAAKKAPGEAVTSSIKIEHNRLKGKSLKQAAKEGAAEELAKSVPFGLGKKKKNEEAKPEYVLKTVYDFNYELLSSSVEAVDAGKFEVPEGYKWKKK
jgi:hypothetical protein